MVQVNAARFATEKGTSFAVDKAGFEEIHETALAFECSVVHEYEKSKTLEGKETGSSSSEDEEQRESIVDPVVYVRQRRTKDNCYHLVMASSFWNNISYNAADVIKEAEKNYFVSFVIKFSLVYCWTLQGTITYLEC